MQIHNLGESNSVLNTFVAQMRDKQFQKNSLLFRNNLHRLGQIFAYEISKTLDYAPKDVITPLGIAHMQQYSSKVVVSTVLRAGLPLHEGILSYFDEAENAFIAAYRKYEKGHDFVVNAEYCTTPPLEGKVLILADTMLATGSSLISGYNLLTEKAGAPLHVHLVCPIASAYAVEQVKKSFPRESTLWTAAIDEELTSHYYIVPGLGDAGDLAYGAKLD